MAREISEKLLRYRKSCIALALASFLSGCASVHQPADISEEELKLNQYAELTSIAAVQKLEQNILSPENKELNVLAPHHYSTAEKALADAKNLLNQNGTKEEIVQKVATGEAVLKNADRFMRKVKDTLSNELTLKQQLEALNTNQTYSGEYDSLVDRLYKIIQGFETGNNDAAENREKLIKDMQQLEQKARRYNAMHEPEEIIKRVKNNGGDTLAPQTYREALEVFVQAEKFILLNPGYSAGIEQVGREALFAAKRAWYITQEVAALSQKFTMSPEQIVLDEEYRMYRVARELGDNDFRDHPLEVQSEMLAKIAIERSKEIKNKDDLVVALRDTLVKVTDSSSQMTELSDVTLQLKQEKGGWLAKEALYKAKLDELTEQLAQSQAQLDKTQQTVLAIQNENLKLTQNLQQTTDVQDSAKIPVVTAQKSQTPPEATQQIPSDNASQLPESANAGIETPAITPDTPENAALPATSVNISVAETIQEPSTEITTAEVSDSTPAAEVLNTPVQSLAENTNTNRDEASPATEQVTEPVVNINTDADRIQTAESTGNTAITATEKVTVTTEQALQISHSAKDPASSTLPNEPETSQSSAIAASAKETENKDEHAINNSFVDANQ